jgi:hypothetical protein
MIPFLTSFLLTVTGATIAIAGWRELVARKAILKLALALHREQQLTQELRERLQLLGVETIVTPGPGRYTVAFRLHFPPANVVALVRGWERPRPRVN